MQVNSSLNSHTLALFGATSEASEAVTITPKSNEAKGTEATKYTVATNAQPSPPAEAKPAAQDSASAYRPSVNPDFLNTYSDPRLADSTASTRVLPYEGPSYTERADGDLLGKIVSDLQAVQSNQLADMMVDYTQRVEAAIGRELTEDERLISFNSHTILEHDDVMMGSKTFGLESVAAAATLSGEHRIIGGLNQEYYDNTTEEERIEKVINNYVRSQIQSINAAIAGANQALAKGYGEGAGEYLPKLSEEEVEVLRSQRLEERRAEYEEGKLVIDFDYSAITR